MNISNFTLSSDQQAALDEIIAFMADPEPGEMALSGPAGTGKTVLTRFILGEARGGSKMALWKLLLNGYTELNVELTSSTNKAATVLSDATGEAAQTIHKLLGLRVMNDYETGHTKVVKTKNTKIIQNSLVIVDEASMVNSELLQMIQDCTKNCKVLYIGDAYQLAPVKENISPVFLKVTKQVKLTTIQRQVAHSPIIQFAAQFRHALDTGIFPVIQSHGIEIQLLDDLAFQQKIEDEFKDTNNVIPSRIIAWANNRVHQYNNHVRGLHSSDTDYKKDEHLITNNPIMRNSTRIFKGDEIVQITSILPGQAHGIDGWHITLNNRHDTFQAYDMAHVDQLIKHYAKQKDWSTYFAMKEFFADLRPYFSSTINKAQGSTFKNVYIDVENIGKNTKKHEIARLMYTAVTRASNHVYMRGVLPERLY